MVRTDLPGRPAADRLSGPRKFIAFGMQRVNE